MKVSITSGVSVSVVSTGISMSVGSISVPVVSISGGSSLGISGPLAVVVAVGMGIGVGRVSVVGISVGIGSVGVVGISLGSGGSLSAAAGCCILVWVTGGFECCRRLFWLSGGVLEAVFGLAIMVIFCKYLPLLGLVCWACMGVGLCLLVGGGLVFCWVGLLVSSASPAQGGLSSS